MGIWYSCVVKQKTAYEMRISDWSSDVCSSDLEPGLPRLRPGSVREHSARAADVAVRVDPRVPVRVQCAVAESVPFRPDGVAVALLHLLAVAIDVSRAYTCLFLWHLQVCNLVNHLSLLLAALFLFIPLLPLMHASALVIPYSF